MKQLHLIAILVVAVIFFSTVLPASNASNITVDLNQDSNSAAVVAFVNSSLSFTLTSNSSFGLNITNGWLLPISTGNLSLPMKYINTSSPAFQALNYSITRKDPSAYLSNLSIGFNRVVHIVNPTGQYSYSANTSLRIGMVISGVFTNNNATLSWRGFSTNQSVPFEGQDVNSVGFNQTIAQASGINSVNLVNMSVFDKSLVQWNKSYNPTTNITTFYMNAGNTIDMNFTQSGTAGSFTFTFTVDPSYTINAPGFDSASTNSITIGNPPASNPAIYYGMAAVLLAGFLIPMYYNRRKAR